MWPPSSSIFNSMDSVIWSILERVVPIRSHTYLDSMKLVVWSSAAFWRFGEMPSQAHDQRRGEAALDAE